MDPTVTDSEVVVSVHTGVGQIVLDRPSRRNALSAAFTRQIAVAAAAMDADPTVHAVVLSSALAEHFCVGADLKERAGLDERGLSAARTDSLAATRALLSLKVPTVAAIRGTALGGGLELALTCDLVVADASALLGFPETGVGIIPGGGGTQLLPRKIGAGRAVELILTGRRLTAREAHEYGIIDILADTDAVDAALSLASTIASKSPTAQRNAKAALREGDGLPLHQALDIEDRHWRSSALSADYREGLTAFVDKRQPCWPDPQPTGAHS